MSMRIRLWVLALLACWQGGQWWLHRAVQQPEGVLTTAEPLQIPEPAQAAPVVMGKYTLSPQAHYHITARLLSTARYRFGREADLSPLDFALGWGPMSDARVLRQLKLWQSARFYGLEWKQQAPLPEAELFEHSANTHLIPANAEIGSQLAKMRVGQVVTLDGQLVNVSTADNWHWQSSLTRKDTGAGACEVLLVQSATIFLRGS